MELTLQTTLAARRTSSQRLFFVDVPPKQTLGFAESVATGLSKEKKSLCCRFLYDETGSQLFDQITGLPEYYLTRCETAILSRKANEIIDCAGTPLSIVELGSGSSAKTRILLKAALRKQHNLQYAPIDISREFLRACATELVDEFDRLLVSAVAGEYLDALRALAPTQEPRLFLFLGSNLGNFETTDACDLLSTLAAAMKPADRLLIGIDLAKDKSIIERAYNDAQGVTARFNKNILARINRELGGKFDLDLFDHSAEYVGGRGRVELSLVSRHDQTVQVGAVDKAFSFSEGERLLTEVSTKYTMTGFHALCDGAGLECTSAWFDPKHYFAEVMARKAP